MSALVAVVFWGVTFSVVGDALHHVEPFNLTAIRYLLATLLLLAVLVWRERRTGLRYEGRFVEAAVLGAVGFAGFNLFSSVALTHTQPQNAALMTALTPLVTVLVRWARDGVRPQLVSLALIALALTGVALVITRGRLDSLASVNIGDLYAFAAVVGWSIYTHGAGRFAAWSPLRYTALTAVAGTGAIVGCTVAANLIGWEHPPTPADVRAAGFDIAFIVLAGTFAASLAWNIAVHRLGAANAALFMNLVPVTAFAVAIVLGYRPGIAELIGALITIAALVAANLHARRSADRRPVADADVSSVPNGVPR
ncbi:DMT family transporter [Planosporangium flavigriseum]|uniref:Transporter n=1 Tax=Planosporangium flavigriseum TaxID=373681 RepID=A0A8J3PMT4_9ACTN|nr:DMT family transporter [Planosporangium flavigriseum]NJC63931.1 DMT family transporter [Planosporangium flavigriseum]GIG74644.1 transporter [Planosporangium flavigriseum]